MMKFALVEQTSQNTNIIINSHDIQQRKFIQTQIAFTHHNLVAQRLSSRPKCVIFCPVYVLVTKVALNIIASGFVRFRITNDCAAILN
jgi:hypothetical protein